MFLGDSMVKAETYRKRANALDRVSKRRRRAEQKPIVHKQKGLRDFATRDWLDGKPGTAIYPDKK